MTELQIEPSNRYVRVFREGELIVDCAEPRLVYGKGCPTYYFHESTVKVAERDILDREGSLVRVRWDDADQWFEEDERLFAPYPRDPRHRVDALPTSRRVRAFVNDACIVDTQRAVAVFETGLPVRYYVPRSEVGAGLMESERRWACQYKGIATYWHLAVGHSEWRDAAWSYPFPVSGCERIRDAISFDWKRVRIEAEWVS